ncbi:MAG: hypothetical protein K6U08_09200, partial [Firmicutes bacterium]|nr:hypothetical protein [Bacillota bacterium]
MGVGGSRFGCTGVPAAARPAGHGLPDAQPVQDAPADDHDRLYEQREDLASARRAADIWQQRLARRPDDFEPAWKLA